MPDDSSEVTVAGDEPAQAITRGARANAAGLLLRLGARLAFLFVAARLFGAQAFGNYVLAVALVELAVSLGSLSTKKTLFPILDRAAQGAARPVFHYVLDAAGMVLAASLVLALVLAGLGKALAPPDVARVLALVAPAIAGQALLDLFIAAGRWRGKVRFEVVGRSLIEPWLVAVGSFGAHFLGLGDGLAIGYWLGTVGALAYVVWGVTRDFQPVALRRYRPDPAMPGRIVRMATSNSANDLLNALYLRIDIYIVGVLLGPAATGVYGMARQVTTPIRQVRQSFDSLLVPALARIIGTRGVAQAEPALASSMRLILAIQLPLLIGIIGAGYPLMAWLGPGFEAGYWALVILGTAEVIQSSFGLGDLVLVYEKPHLALGLTALGIAAGVGIAMVAIPSLGITGAAFASLAAYGLRAVLRLAVLRRHFGLPVPFSAIAGPVLVCIPACAAAAWLSPPLLASAAGLGLYFVLLRLWLANMGQSLDLAGFSLSAQDASGSPSEFHGAETPRLRD